MLSRPFELNGLSKREEKKSRLETSFCPLFLSWMEADLKLAVNYIKKWGLSRENDTKSPVKF